jgi:hypothetical protein
MQLKAVDIGSKTLHPHHIRLLRLREAASRLAIECGDWQVIYRSLLTLIWSLFSLIWSLLTLLTQLAESLVTALLSTYRAVYPQGWPILGVQVRERERE